MDQFINTICKVFELLALIIGIDSDDEQILPTTRYDTCASTGFAKSPSIDSTIRRSNSRVNFLTVVSV